MRRHPGHGCARTYWSGKKGQHSAHQLTLATRDNPQACLACIRTILQSENVKSCPIKSRPALITYNQCSRIYHKFQQNKGKVAKSNAQYYAEDTVSNGAKVCMLFLRATQDDPRPALAVKNIPVDSANAMATKYFDLSTYTKTQQAHHKRPKTLPLNQPTFGCSEFMNVHSTSPSPPKEMNGS